MDDPTQVFEYLCETEAVAEEILAARQQIVRLENQRNKCREASRILTKSVANGEFGKKTPKSYVGFGNIFIKMETAEVQKFLTKDQETLKEEVKTLRTGLHTNFDKLQELEGKPELTGFKLKALV